ncbi:MAG: lytic transglycosylase domain-containing protein, partial [Pseudomonadota bacterium]|nr:lytic transglycosylase domain-containing protein [Pseudomonadota bacterium]
MFLSASNDVGQRVAAAIDRASRSTGTDFGYLLKTAKRESSLDPGAKAQTSSAAGLFQFIDRTWLEVLYMHGAAHGFAAAAAAIRMV